MFGSEQSCIGEPLMRIENISVLIGREQGLELVVAENHQRMVCETVAVIIHVGTVEKEGGVARLGYISIPDLLVSIGVFSDLKHDI